MTAVIGVDPGKSGAIALVRADGRLNQVIPMPTTGKGKGSEIDQYTLTAILRTLQSIANDLCIVGIEEVHAMPKQGVSSSFDFGKSFGIALGAIAGSTMAVRRVRPAEWKKTFSLNGKDKDMARGVASELWPDHTHEWKTKNRVDKAEACLIAEHVRRNL